MSRHLSVCGCLLAVVHAVFTFSPAAAEAQEQVKSGLLSVTLVDELTGQPTPARVELLDQQGKSYIAEDALLVGGDCRDREEPWQVTMEEAVAQLSPKILNRYTGTEQFYSRGQFQVALPAGSYKLRAFKGLEYRIPFQEVQIKAGATTEAAVKLSRWADLPRQGWYSSDAHLHIPRPVKELNPQICQWMKAEDIHVANLLQYGLSKRFHNSWQFAHGPDGLYHEGDYWLATGQENPRSHILGHTLTLGAQTPIHRPDDYLIYQRVFEDARRQNAVSGWVHFAEYASGKDGIPVDLLDGLVSFIEVLQFERADYSIWYDALNLGMRVAPIAGTDYPCGPYLPGRERFYTRVEGKLDYATWLEGVRRGRTFVTNGPLLTFRVDGKEIGDQITLANPGSVSIEARVRFDAARDDVQVLEVVANGEVLRRFERQENASEIGGTFDMQVLETSWLAIRASGKKLTEGRSPFSPNHAFYHDTAPALAHSGAIYVTVPNTPELSKQPRARIVALAWLGRLDDLEKRLADDKIASLARWPSPRLDGVDLETVRRNRPALLERIQSAKRRFKEIADGTQK